MKLLVKILKPFILFLIIFIVFLFSPISFFFPRKVGVEIPGQNVNLYYENDVLLEDQYNENHSIPICTSCLELETEETNQNIEEDEQENRSNSQPNCSIEREIVTDDFRVYQEDGYVYVEIFGEVTTKKGTSAYDFVRKQGCLTSSPNLIFITEQ